MASESSKRGFKLAFKINLVQCDSTTTQGAYEYQIQDRGDELLILPIDQEVLIDLYECVDLMDPEDEHTRIEAFVRNVGQQLPEAQTFKRSLSLWSLHNLLNHRQVVRR